MLVLFLLPRNAYPHDRVARLSLHTDPVGESAVLDAIHSHLVPVLEGHNLRRVDSDGVPVAPDAVALDFSVSAPVSFDRFHARMTADPRWVSAFAALSADLGARWSSSLQNRSVGVWMPGRWPAAGSRRDPLPAVSVRRSEGRPHLKAFDVIDGLAGSTVMAIEQLYSGELLFGTETGPCLFDGKRWRTLAVTDASWDPHVNDVAATPGGAIVGGRGGLTTYDGTHTAPSDIPLINITSLVVDRRGRTWIGTGQGGVYVVDGSSGETVLTLTAADGLPSDWVYDVYEDSRGRFLIATIKGVGVYEDGRITALPSLAGRTVKTICEDTRGRLWFGTLRGVVRLDGERVDALTTEDGLPDNEVRVIFCDRDEQVWVGTESGLVRDDGRSWTLFTTESGLPGDAVISAEQDDEGHLWFGTYRGAVRLDPNTFATFTRADGLPDNRVMAITQDGDGRVWTGTKRGVSAFDGAGWQTYDRDLPHTDVRAAACDARGRPWFGTEGGGAFRIDGRDVTVLDRTDGLVHDEIRKIYLEPAGDLWFGYWNGRGVTRWFEDRLESFSTHGIDPDGILRPHKVWDLMRDRNGVLWVATNGGGVLRVEDDRSRVIGLADGLAGLEVRALLEDDDGNLWFGTQTGLSRFDGFRITNYGVEDGLSHPEVRSLLKTQDGHLWVGTRGGGVNRFDGRVFSAMTRADGLAGNQVVSMFQDRSGDIWLGTNSGVTRFRQPPPLPPEIAVTSVSTGPPHDRVDAVSFPSTTDHVRFDFRGSSLKTRSDALSYRVRLRGYHDEWRVTRDDYAEYRDLPVGEFVFEVEAVDRDLVYSSAPAIVHVSVLPPYGRYTWIGLLLVAVAVAAYQTRRVVDRGRELRHSYSEVVASHAALERVEVERNRLDEQVRSLDYLSRLRLELSEVRSSDEAVRIAGATLAEVLEGSEGGRVVIELDGETRAFGSAPETPHPYGRPLAWGGRDRGRLTVDSVIALSPRHEQSFLDATAGQLSRTLEAQELNQQLLQSARLVSMGQIAAGVAHEMNQPLGGIEATLEDFYLRLKEGRSVTPEQWREMLGRLLGMADRMTGIIEHLLVFSRETEAGDGVRYDVNDVVNDALGIIGTQIRNHGIEVELNLDESVPDLSGHPRQIEQVMLNLLGNARDAVGEGSGNGRARRIRVASRRDDGHVVVDVADNGVGILPENLDLMFRPFFTTKPEGKGTGLGLSISEAIVKSHRGEMRVKSDRGEGTTVSVYLPIQEEAGT